MSHSFATSRQSEICNSLSDWTVARLAGNGSISGAGNNCKIYKVDHRDLGSSLCVAFTGSSEIRGVLLAGGFRSQSELVAMSKQDWRDVLITELANRTAGSLSEYAKLDNIDLAGIGMLLVYQLGYERNGAASVAQMTAQDIRSTAIQNLNRQTGIPIKHLSELENIELAKLFAKG